MSTLQHITRFVRKIRNYLLSHRWLSISIAIVIVVVFALFAVSPFIFFIRDSEQTETDQTQSSEQIPSMTSNSESTTESNRDLTTTTDQGTPRQSESSTEQTHTDSDNSSSQTTTSSSELPELTSADPTTTTQTAATTQTSTTNDPTTSVDQNQIYVDPNGIDQSGNGSESTPFRTIQYAIESADRNTTIRVAPGVYSERLDFEQAAGLTVIGAADGSSIISGKSFSDGYLIEISRASDISLKNLTIRDFRGDNLECVLIRRDSRDIEIEGCAFANIGVYNPSGNAHIILVEGDSVVGVKNISVINNKIMNCFTGYSEAVTMESNVDGFEISGNLIHDVTNIGIDVAGFYSNGVNDPTLNQARNGRIADNTLYNIESPNASCAAIYVDGGRDIVIERNRVYRSTYGIELGCENRYDEDTPGYEAAASGITVRYNTIYKCAKAGIMVGGYDNETTGTVRDSNIYNNTLYKNRNEIELSRCNRISFSKNIIFGNGNDNYFLYHHVDSEITDLSSDDNIFYTDSGVGRFKYLGSYASGLASWQQISGIDLSSSYIDPQFIDPANGKFLLVQGSAAAGYGAQSN